MAYKEKMSEDLRIGVFDGINADHFWAIHKTVGWGCPNKKDDVMLVQYLINVWAKSKALEMDGIFGNKTNSGIKSFQKWINQGYGSKTLIADGKVSSTDGNHYLTNSERFYTIHLLNMVFWDERRIYYNDPRMDRVLPTELCHVLSLAP